ncbi:MAG TPA: prephenate dehydrogenase/arogenate dehydrogenase family protein [Casimicrobiaceae bacterium]|jgi:prephenate dehydrogenase|nr:prephenate dehydrogenase/arogenate dehydrogenase family protein [Casimicrobiaceae bacterium]
MKLIVVGVGLIGGSCALALKAHGAAHDVVGVGRTRANLDEALSRGIVDRAYALDEPWGTELRDADVVLVATPVAQIAPVLARIASAMGPSTVVTDAGSTKEDVVAAARDAFGARLARFVPAHPIAGTEHSGAASAFPTLFRDRTTVVTPLRETAPDALATVRALWERCGARVIELEPAQHDRIFAAVSHLPHVLAFALVAQLAARPDAADLFAHAASGFRDFTRIAGSSPEMWRDIALANRGALSAALRDYRELLATLAAAIDSGDGAALERVFAQASDARRRWQAGAGAPKPVDR